MARIGKPKRIIEIPVPEEVPGGNPSEQPQQPVEIPKEPVPV
jgi:hypothetical protein